MNYSLKQDPISHFQQLRLKLRTLTTHPTPSNPQITSTTLQINQEETAGLKKQTLIENETKECPSTERKGKKIIEKLINADSLAKRHMK